ncbi:MAG TPA: hypothetical protein VE619_00975 [Nitrososphaeraceae archaeon]|nr:hypothetical protein [Nitrososphaeraceae archaeon]
MAITDWERITITFRTKCKECRKDILPGDAFWSTSAKVAKHIICNKSTIPNSTGTLIEDLRARTDQAVREIAANEPKCYICCGRAGCIECEHLANCEQRVVSKYCICKSCSKDDDNKYEQGFLLKVSKYLICITKYEE